MSSPTAVKEDEAATATGPGGTGDAPGRQHRRWRLWIAASLLGLLAVFAAAAVVEVRTSELQSRIFTRIAAGVGWDIGEGPSDALRFPGHGPFDERMGYTEIPRIVERATERGFHVAEQARVTPRFASLVDRGAYPVYAEKPQGGLTLLDRSGEPFLRSPHPARVYPRFDSIPELLWRSLLHIESREFLDDRYPRRNPAVEWDRLARGVGEIGLRALGSERNVPGGSTLATQLEKFRHSPGGLTTSPIEKLRQMGTASLRAYLDGPETMEDQRRIVREYLNSVPLAAQRGHGEVTGTADGLWAWYGTSFDEANALLRAGGAGTGDLVAVARAYRQALSLLVAHRRPSYYLARERGREDLVELTDTHLRLLVRDGVIPSDLAAAALRTEVEILSRAPERAPLSFVERKAANQVRSRLLSLLGAPSLYELDRWDLTVATSLDMGWQESVGSFFASLHDPSFVRERGFAVDRLLGGADPSPVIYSFTLMETTPLGNVVRVQTDNFDGPLSLTQASRLELGSTAKLRTLVTYLEVVAELHERLSGLPGDSLRTFPVASRDRLTRWAVSYLRANPSAELRTMLDAAMERTYSANPDERFATGGGVQAFSNFDDTYDARVMTVREAFRQSVNLPSVRTMRDVVSYYMFRTPGSTARVLEDVRDPARQEYLARFADQEGSRFVRQFHAKYADAPGGEILERLVRNRNLGPQRVAWAYRTVAPGASLELFASFLRGHAPYSALSDDAVSDLYRRSDPGPHDINDLGYLARVHPLELWVVRHLLDHPGASQGEVLEASRDVRQEVYRWLFRSRSRSAQDQRIGTVLEIEAFQEIHRAWQRVGYPFQNIVPSLGTAIGSSGDRPLALAELVGIIVNGGVRYPVATVEALHLAEATPFETRLERDPARGERVLPEEVAAVVRDALVDVVENGTGRRARGALRDAAGEPLVVGGKTGTGDNRYRIFGAGGRVVEDRVVNRTSTLAFFAGDRYFGVVTAYVPGPQAARYRFTSALPSEILRQVGPSLGGLE